MNPGDKLPVPIRIIRRATAVHEAGHAIVAHVFGQRIEFVTIEEGEHQKGAAPFYGKGTVATIAAQLAGGLAERRVMRGFPTDLRDRQLALEQATLTCWRDKSVIEPLLHQCSKLADFVLEDEWGAVLGLADELVAKRRIDGSDSMQIIETHICKIRLPRYERARHAVVAWYLGLLRNAMKRQTCDGPHCLGPRAVAGPGVDARQPDPGGNSQVSGGLSLVQRTQLPPRRTGTH